MAKSFIRIEKQIHVRYFDFFSLFPNMCSMIVCADDNLLCVYVPLPSHLKRYLKTMQFKSMLQFRLCAFVSQTKPRNVWSRLAFQLQFRK